MVSNVLRIKCEIKNRAFIQFSFGPDMTAMLVDNSFNRRQSDAGPFKLLSPMQALKDTEKLIREFHVKADAVIPNKNCPLPFYFHLANFDNRLFAGPAVFD